MDELTIDERKYISSKRAALITGYAKDYVGQLCRGGYVPARRVGRNWYVLESAIKDHRFGVTSSENPAPPPMRSGHATTAIPEVQEAPRYTALDVEFPEPASGPLRGDFQEAWQAWFEMFRGRESSVIETDRPEVLPESITDEEVPIVSPPAGEEEAGTQSMPMQTFTHNTPQQSSNMPVSSSRTQHIPAQQMGHYRGYRPTSRPVAGRGRLVMRIVLILVTTTLAWAAVLSTGFFDKSIASYRQVQLLSGVSQYDKSHI